jgi:hypothetical protein
MSYKFVTVERTLTVTVPELFVAERLSSLPGLKQSLGGHRFKDDREVKKRRDTMADKTGHGILSVENKRFVP